MEQYTKRQHYVWRHYLDAWATNGTFCCYRQKDKKLFSPQPKDVASESYFYETQQLTIGDKLRILAKMNTHYDHSRTLR